MPPVIAITGCSVLSPLAMTLAEFADRLSVPATPPDGPRRLPLDRFDPQEHLGPRGFEYLTPATQYALAAARMALDDAAFDEAAYAPEERAVVVGTNFGVHAVLAGMDRTILGSGAQYLRPMEAPNFSVNIPASHLSMKHHFSAANLTLTTAQVAGLEAVLLGVDMLRAGRARLALVCATEGEPPEDLERMYSAPLAEGAACALVLESLDDARRRGAGVRGEVWGGAARFLPMDPATHDAEVAALVDEIVCGLMPPGAEPLHVSRHDIASRFGECASVSPLLQVLAMCAGGAPQAIVAAVSLQGHVVALSGRGHGLGRPD